MDSFPLLSAIAYLPLVGALIIFFIPHVSKETARAVALLTALGSFVLSLILLFGFDHNAEFQYEEEEHHVSTRTTVIFGIISTAAAGAGILFAVSRYRGVRTPEEIVERDRALYGPAYAFLRDKWRFDELYDAIVVRPAADLATFCWRVVDVGIIDAAVNGVATGIGAVSQRLRHVQTGLVANYALAIALGMVVMVGVYLAAFSNLFR